MPDMAIQIHQSEVYPLSASLTALTGTDTTTAATFGVVDHQGVPKVTAGAACTGYDPGPLSTSRAWVELTPAAWGLLANNDYVLTILFSVMGSDNNARTRTYVVWLYVIDDVS